MKAAISVITLGVEDLERAVSFYRDGMGLPTKGIIGEQYDHGAVAFFDLHNGSKLALWPRTSIAQETGVPVTQPSSTELMLASNVSSIEEVNEVMLQAEMAGADLLKPAQETFYGAYAGYFRDPDGHIWEVVYNPNFF